MTTPADRQDSNDEPGGRPSSSSSSSSIESLVQGVSKVKLEGSTPLAWCSKCRGRASGSCGKGEHDVVSVRDALGLKDELREDWGEQGLRVLALLNSKAWRKVFEEPLVEPLRTALVSRVVGQTAPSKDHAAPAARSLDVGHINHNSTTEQKAKALQDVKGATQLYNLHCNVELKWSLQMLKDFKPTGQHLTMFYPDTAHLGEVCGVRLLKELHVYCGKKGRPELPSEYVGPLELKILKLLCFSQETARSLLQAHASTLKDLQVFVGTETEGLWPDNAQLDSLLRGCGQWPNLTRLVLGRNRKNMKIELKHNCDKCKAQRIMVKGVLPDTTKIECGACDSVRLQRAPPPQSE